MAPPLKIFPVEDLALAIQSVPINYRDKRRKVRDFNLDNCDLLEMVQFSCDPPEIRIRKPITAPMICEPVVRLFRRCGKGSKMFTVETTAWEGDLAKENAEGLRPSEAFAKVQREKVRKQAESEPKT